MSQQKNTAELTVFTPEELAKFNRELKVGDKVEIWFQEDSNPLPPTWELWKGSVRTEAAGKSRTTGITYYEGPETPMSNDKMYPFPYPGYRYATASVRHPKQAPPAKKTMEMMDVPEEDAEEYDEKEVRETDRLLMGNVGAIALDPQRWKEVTDEGKTPHARQNRVTLMEYLKENYKDKGRGKAENYVIEDCLITLDYLSKLQLEYSKLADEEAFVMACKRLMSRMELYKQMSIGNYDAQTIGVLAQQMNQQGEPRWITEARTAAAQSVRNLSSLKTQTRGGYQGKPYRKNF
jgi:hypothetical protein